MQRIREKDEKETGDTDEGQADGALNAGEHFKRRAQRWKLVAISGLQKEHAERCPQNAAAENRQKGFETPIGRDTVDNGGDDHKHRKFQKPQLADHHVRRMVAGAQLVGNLPRQRIENDSFRR